MAERRHRPRRGPQEAGGTHPLLLAALSALLLWGTLHLCIEHEWRLGDSIGSGWRRGPLWLVALVGLPLWSLGVAVGVWRAVSPRRRGGRRRE